MQNDISRILLTEEAIQNRIAEMGRRIADDYAGKNPVMVCILKGAVMFYTDLLRATPIKLTMDFMAVSSYSGTSSTGAVLRSRDTASFDTESTRTPLAASHWRNRAGESALMPVISLKRRAMLPR